MVYCVLFISSEGRYGCLANYKSHNTFTRSSEHSGEGVFVSHDHIMVIFLFQLSDVNCRKGCKSYVCALQCCGPF